MTGYFLWTNLQYYKIGLVGSKIGPVEWQVHWFNNDGFHANQSLFISSITDIFAKSKQLKVKV